MSAIRPLERDDLPAVARLYELVARSGRESPPPGLADEFARTVLDHPWVDPELPSLVYEDPRAGLVGFIGSHPRRLRFGERRLRLGCSGQLVAHPDFQRRGIGALLLRRYLAGPQELSVTDGATDTVRAMWEGLGGKTNPLTSIGWTRIFGPLGFAAATLSRRRGRGATGSGLTGLLDRAAGRPLSPSSVPARSEPLTASALVEADAALERHFPLRPDYDEPFLEWLFSELQAVTPRGELVRRLVRTADGRVAGWYFAYLQPGGMSQLLQLAAAPDDAGQVLDELFAQLAGRGTAAVQGRVEPHLYAALRERRCLFRRTEWALVHTEDAAVLSALGFGGALLTRLEGEWWMGHHLPCGA